MPSLRPLRRLPAFSCSAPRMETTLTSLDQPTAAASAAPGPYRAAPEPTAIAGVAVLAGGVTGTAGLSTLLMSAVAVASPPGFTRAGWVCAAAITAATALVGAQSLIVSLSAWSGRAYPHAWMVLRVSARVTLTATVALACVMLIRNPGHVLPAGWAMLFAVGARVIAAAADSLARSASTAAPAETDPTGSVSWRSRCGHAAADCRTTVNAVTAGLLWSILAERAPDPPQSRSNAAMAVLALVSAVAMTIAMITAPQIHTPYPATGINYVTVGPAYLALAAAVGLTVLAGIGHNAYPALAYSAAASPALAHIGAAAARRRCAVRLDTRTPARPTVPAGTVRDQPRCEDLR
jgi:hypothetical protein